MKNNKKIVFLFFINIFLFMLIIMYVGIFLKMKL
ncbi:hypothetical protein K08M3_18780 [Vibrio alginolyticus]|uniref:Uncharacterized protein n=1 Tax=Vibrio alginolyticus TaxID=663 RepID=A0A1W6TSD4_VIBAL|nr:hypothetical protein K01M1_18740 [Vibrio alginolyticus]ARP03531.1 hypothetical protein K04M1_18870 [Vibrio alginolyticus]ARP08591.1 hypothetical protein K04M3_18900 [Vibrio alginolyticus]ARP13666.1 hypothetical protein K04M5_18780 [Vibrio alginolyticus]ARP18726.1 hypothetical protein K05K4_18920 [Vibrio alginolyticus]